MEYLESRTCICCSRGRVKICRGEPNKTIPGQWGTHPHTHTHKLYNFSGASLISACPYKWKGSLRFQCPVAAFQIFVISVSRRMSLKLKGSTALSYTNTLASLSPHQQKKHPFPYTRLMLLQRRVLYSFDSLESCTDSVEARGHVWSSNLFTQPMVLTSRAFIFLLLLSSSCFFFRFLVSTSASIQPMSIRARERRRNACF